ncbi:MAG: energy-coupling factor ABC transporter permease [Acidobacteriota bacterium]|nr:energy-coupling factor ABC transporter permease [Acidobacteriota bacterium]
MHIPDNFLSVPVWASLDVVTAPAFAIIARRAGKDLGDGSRIPMLGVMGAFVFAAQMINFPVGLGTSGHLVGGALLAYTLGPAAATVAMTAIIAVQALVFQDGGVLALGANVFNMGIAGVLAAWLPFRIWGGGSNRRIAIFVGAFLSVLVSAGLALSELLVSGVRMPGAVVLVSAGLFAVSALLEGAITVAVLGSIEKLNPVWRREPSASGGKMMAAVAIAAVLLVVAGFMLASTAPDGLQRLGSQLGLGGGSAFHAPLADYAVPVLSSIWLKRAAAGLAGLTLVFAACVIAGRLIRRQRSV